MVVVGADRGNGPIGGPLEGAGEESKAMNEAGRGRHTQVGGSNAAGWSRWTPTGATAWSAGGFGTCG